MFVFIHTNASQWRRTLEGRKKKNKYVSLRMKVFILHRYSCGEVKQIYTCVMRGKVWTKRGLCICVRNDSAVERKLYCAL